VFASGSIRKSNNSTTKKNNLGTENILPANVFTINNKWAEIFHNKISLTNGEKNDKLKIIKCTKEHINFDTYNDIVLDKIISIEKCDTDKYKKLYDLTIPKTLNFQISNGLNLRDTAETGYTQRKLIKSMEDIMVRYDGTIRSSNDRIIQLVYGDSGADTTKQYEYLIKMIEMSNDEIKDKFVFTSDELEIVNGSNEDNKKLYETVIDIRDLLRESIIKATMKYIVLKDKFMLPVNINRIVDTIMGTTPKNTKALTPSYIVNQIEAVLENDKTTLIYMSNEERSDKTSFKRRDEALHKIVFRAALYDSINPKRMLIELKANKSQFDKIIEEIAQNFNKNMIEPGEMAGIVAAQSCGEPLQICF
jgi:DNA-directed RNA polymerase, beta'' subunit/160 kD subunit